MRNRTNILPSFNGNNIISSNSNQAGFTPPNRQGFNTNRFNNTETVTIKPIETINIDIKDNNLSVKKTNQKLLKTSINSESSLKSLKEKNVNLPNIQNVNDTNSLSISSANNTLSSTRFNIRLRLPKEKTPSKLFRTISQPVNATSNANVLNTIEPSTVESIKSQNLSLIIEDENKNNSIKDASRSNAEINFTNRVRLPNVEEGNRELFMSNGVNKTLESVDNSNSISSTDTDIYKAVKANSTDSEIVPVFSGEAYNRYYIDDSLIIKNASTENLSVNFPNVEAPSSKENGNQNLSLPNKINEPVQKELINNESTFSLPNESNSSALEFGSPQNTSTIGTYKNDFQNYNNSEIRNIESRADISILHRTDITNNTNNSVDNNSFIPGLLNEPNSPKLLDLNEDNETIIGIVPAQGLNLSVPVQIQDNVLNNSLININNDSSVIYKENNESNQELLETTQEYEAITSALPLRENLNFTISARYYNFTTDNESQIVLSEEVTNPGLSALNEESLVNETISEEINEHLLSISNNTEVVTNIDTPISVTSSNDIDIRSTNAKQILISEDRYKQISLNFSESTDLLNGTETTTLEAATISIANSYEITDSVGGDETTTLTGETRSIDVLNSNGITDPVEEAERTTLRATTISVGGIISDINYNSESTTIIDSDF